MEDVLAYSMDEEWGRYLPVPQPYTRRFGEEYLARCVLTDWGKHPVFAVVLGGKVVGGIDLYVDTTNNIAELGYSISQNHWGKGLTLEAATVVIDWGFRTFGLAKVFAGGGALNRRSWRVMEKLGMKREGLLRSHRLVRGERTDEVVYGVLREEWCAKQQTRRSCAWPKTSLAELLFETVGELPRQVRGHRVRIRISHGSNA